MYREGATQPSGIQLNYKEDTLDVSIEAVEGDRASSGLRYSFRLFLTIRKQNALRAICISHAGI